MHGSSRDLRPTIKPLEKITHLLTFLNRKNLLSLNTILTVTHNLMSNMNSLLQSTTIPQFLYHHRLVLNVKLRKQLQTSRLRYLTDRIHLENVIRVFVRS